MKLQRIGLTHGDINGIGYEVLLKVLQDPELLEFCTPIIFGSAKIAQATAAQIGIEQVPLYTITNAADAIDGHINLVQVCNDNELELQFGQQTEAALQAEANSLTAALDAFTHRHIDALVTLPGHLDNDADSHALTDFIHRALGSEEDAFDWIINGALRTLELHMMDVSTELGEGLAREAFLAHLKAISNNLRLDFGMIRPRLAVISPQEKLRSAIEELQEEGIMAFGPFVPHTFTEANCQLHYDGNLYLDAPNAHKQALMQQDAEYTIGYVSGLPLVLTYPLQSISYDIAGRGEASEISLRQAIYAAIDIVRARINYRHATHHPLEKQWIPRGRDDFKLDLTKED